MSANSAVPAGPQIGFNLVPLLAAIARQDVNPEADLLTAVQQLRAGSLLRMSSPVQLPRPLISGVELVTEADDASVVLVTHTRSAASTAAEVEQRMIEGQRIALLDAQYEGKGDPELIQALLDNTVYLSSLAAYDTDVIRLQAALLTPMRDGMAHRRYLAHSILYNWAWQGIVRAELERRFGQVIEPIHEQRACHHARARLGAYLLRCGQRGLRFQMTQIGFHENRLDGLWFTLDPVL